MHREGLGSESRASRFLCYAFGFRLLSDTVAKTIQLNQINVPLDPGATCAVGSADRTLTVV